MKKLKAIIGVLASSLMLGAAVGISTIQNNQTFESVSAEGTIDMDAKILISLKQDSWTTASVKTAVYFWKGATHAWSSNYVLNYVQYDGTNKIYMVDVPSGTWEYFKCVRVNPSKAPATPNDNIWNVSDTNWGESSNQSYSGDNTFEPLIGGGYRYGTALKLQAGKSLYLDLNGQGWTSDGRKVCAYFWNNTAGAGATKLEMTNVLGWDNGNKNLYEAVVPGSGFWGNVLFYRSTSKDGSWDNQTGDLTGNTNNVYKLTSFTGGSFDWDFTNDSRADALGTYFCDTLEAQCTHSATNTKSSFTTPWANIKAQYTSTNSSVKNIFKNATPATSGTNKCDLAAAKYDYCVAKYDLENFASRSISFSFAHFPIDILGLEVGGSNNTALIVIIVSAVSVTAIGGYFFLRKRKQDR